MMQTCIVPKLGVFEHMEKLNFVPASLNISENRERQNLAGSPRILFIK